MNYIERLCLEAGIGGEQLITFAGESFLLPTDIEAFESVCSDCADVMDAAEEGYNLDQYSKYSQAMKKASKLAREAKKLSKTGSAREVKDKMKECIDALKDARKEVADAMKRETKKESIIGTVLYYLQQISLYAVTIAGLSAAFTVSPSFRLGIAMNKITSTQFIAKNVAAGATGAGLGTLVGHIFTHLPVSKYRQNVCR